MYPETELKNIMSRLQLKRKAVIRSMSELPDGRLMVTKNNGKQSFFNDSTVDGKRRRITVNNDSRQKIGLVRKVYLARELDQIDANISAVSTALKMLADNQYITGMRFLLERYPQLSDGELSSAIDGSCMHFSADGSYILSSAIDGSNTASSDESSPDYEWSVNYNRSKYKPEELVHRTSRGIYVRTKSEAIIAEQLYNAQSSASAARSSGFSSVSVDPIQIRYEEVLDFPERICVPDFTIKRADGKIFYWEHEGLMTVEKYRQRQRLKHDVYAIHGIVPWDNLIVTYDYGDGEIDLRIIESEIRNKLIV